MTTSEPEHKVTLNQMSVDHGFDLNNMSGVEEAGLRRFSARHSLAPKKDPLSDRHAGLGKSIGSQLTKTALGGAAYQVLDPLARTRQKRFELSVQTLKSYKIIPLPPDAATEGMFPMRQSSMSRPQTTPNALRDGEVPGAFQQLLLCQEGWPTEQARREELRIIREHRWTFYGALELAERSRSYCLFVRCLLDLQRNVQLEEEGSLLDPYLLQACTSFVTSQCSTKRAGDVYQMLTHFISNSVIFDEWDKYLKEAFESTRAQEESFLIPYLEQVWLRFCRFVDILEEIFRNLNVKFVRASFLPSVRDLVQEHMRRRCFCTDAVTRNRIFVQEKCRSDTVKAIKRTLGLGS